MRLRAWFERSAPALAAALLLCAATHAAAFPVIFGGAGGYGVSAGTASSAEGAGFSLIDAPIFPANDFLLPIPVPNVLHWDVHSSATLSNPNTAQSRWSVTAGESDLNDAWLVFFRPVTYTANRVGIDLQGGGRWALVEVAAGGTDYFYPAVFLGDLDADSTVTFLMNHIVGMGLTQTGPTTYVLPQYQVGVLQGVPLPEPATLGLLVAGFAFAAALRRGKV